MFYVPTRTELATISKRLNLPTIPTKNVLSALIDIYSDFPDTEYEDILGDIDAEYLTYKDETYIRYVINGTDKEISPLGAIYGYLHYDDGDVETTVAITK